MYIYLFLIRFIYLVSKNLMSPSPCPPHLLHHRKIIAEFELMIAKMMGKLI